MIIDLDATLTIAGQGGERMRRRRLLLCRRNDGNGGGVRGGIFSRTVRHI